MIGARRLHLKGNVRRLNVRMAKFKIGSLDDFSERALIEDELAAMGKAGSLQPPPLALMHMDLGAPRQDGAMANTKREGTRVCIEGVPDAKFGIQWDMYIRAMQTLLAFRGVKAEFNELLALSGDAFNLCHASKWQGVAYLCIPANPMANLPQAYGFDYGHTHLGDKGPLLARKMRAEREEMTRPVLERIYAEVDAGRPVVLPGAEDHCGSVSLAVGYDRGKTMLCHVGDREPYRWTLLRGVARGALDQRDFGCMDGRCRGTVTDHFVGGWQANPAYLIGTKLTARRRRARSS